MEAGRMPDHWLDSVIESVWRENNPQAIARAITHSDHLLRAISSGLAEANKPKPPHWVGPTHAQFVRQAVVDALMANS
jgi:hypothetical protein